MTFYFITKQAVPSRKQIPDHVLYRNTTILQPQFWNQTLSFLDASSIHFQHDQTIISSFNTSMDDFLDELPMGDIQHESLSDLSSSDSGVAVGVFNSMSEQGWTSGTCAVGISSANDLDDPSVLAELGIETPLSRLDRAIKSTRHRTQHCIRHLWNPQKIAGVNPSLQN